MNSAKGVPRSLVPGVAEHLFERGIARDDASLEVPDGHPEGRGLEGRPEPLLARAQRLLGSLAPGDVEERVPDAPALRAADPEDIEVVPALVGRGVPLEADAFPRPGHVAEDLEPVLLVVRAEFGEPFARVVLTEHPCRGGVRLHVVEVHGPVVLVEEHVDDEEALVDRVEEGAVLRLALAHCLLGPLPLGDVMGDPHDPARLARGIPHGLEGQVVVIRHAAEGRPHLCPRTRPRFEHLPLQSHEHSSIVRREEIGVRHPEDVRACIRRVGVVDPDVPQVAVVGEEDRGRIREREPEPRLALPHGLLGPLPLGDVAEDAYTNGYLPLRIPDGRRTEAEDDASPIASLTFDLFGSYYLTGSHGAIDRPFIGPVRTTVGMETAIPG